MANAQSTPDAIKEVHTHWAVAAHGGRTRPVAFDAAAGQRCSHRVSRAWGEWDRWSREAGFDPGIGTGRRLLQLVTAEPRVDFTTLGCEWQNLFKGETPHAYQVSRRQIKKTETT